MASKKVNSELFLIPCLLMSLHNRSMCTCSLSQKPQWLEMRSISPTAIKSVPTRLILKQGDDLRQDMITLKMFSLFQKVCRLSSLCACAFHLFLCISLQLWEKDGLPNLCLIPYGCMATSPKTGFIEVVKSARTIAEVHSSEHKKYNSIMYCNTMTA